MNYIATITSKRQLTLPSKLTKKLNLKPGQKLAIKEENGFLVMVPAVQLVEKLSGSLKLPDSYKDKSMDEIIKQAKEEYFAR